MSSFICSREHFNSVEYYLVQTQLSKDPIYCLRKLAKTSNKSATPEEITAFMDTLRELSVLCVSLQYRHHHKNGLDAEIAAQRKTLFSNKTPRVHLAEISAYKALQSVNYQLEISHLIEIRQLTPVEEQAMELLGDISNEIAAKIIRKLSAYEKAAWSI